MSLWSISLSWGAAAAATTAGLKARVILCAAGVLVLKMRAAEGAAGVRWALEQALHASYHMRTNQLCGPVNLIPDWLSRTYELERPYEFLPPQLACNNDQTRSLLC